MLKGNNFTFELDILSIARMLTAAWTLFNFLIFLICIKLIGQTFDGITYLICFYWISLAVFNYYSFILRIKLDGTALLILSSADALMSVFILFSLFYFGLESFIFLNGFKFFIKAYVAKHQLEKRHGPIKKFANPTLSAYLVSAKELFKIGGGLSFKGIVQTISQYGDKFLFGLMLSGEALGFISLGSVLAIPLAVVLSSYYTWSLPSLITDSYVKDNSKTFSLIFVLIMVYPLSAFLLFLIYDLSLVNFSIVFYASIFMLLQISLNFSCGLLFKKYGTWVSALIQLFVTSLCYLVVYLCFQLGSELTFAISAGSLFLLVLIACILFISLRYKALYVLLFGVYLIYPFLMVLT